MFGFLNRCRNSLAQHHRRAAAARELSALDDRQLKDIGISRSQIGSVVDGFDPRRDGVSGL